MNRKLQIISRYMLRQRCGFNSIRRWVETFRILVLIERVKVIFGFIYYPNEEAGWELSTI